MILDAPRALLTRATDPRSLLLALYPDARIPPLSHVVATATPMVARVNHGVWIASCSCGAKGNPPAGCVVSLIEPLGWCVRCHNRAWGGGWRPITVPVSETVAQIEAILVCRPNIGDRNWEPEETVADLLAQNREHGDPVPDLAAVRIREAQTPSEPWPGPALRAALRGMKRRRRW